MASWNSNEAYLSTVEDPPCAHAWLSGAHEDPRRSGRHQLAAGEGSQASRCLTPSPGRPRLRPEPQGHAVPERLIHKIDIDALMAAEPWSRSAHFAVHHLARRPSPGSQALERRSSGELSTGTPECPRRSVDKPADRVWVGTVVPKRHAQRAVTRNLLKRQMRSAFFRHGATLPLGLWLVRLRRPFEAAKFSSAASELLRTAAGAELERLFAAPPGGMARSRPPALAAPPRRGRSR